jgi:hypothetical protein
VGATSRADGRYKLQDFHAARGLKDPDQLKDIFSLQDEIVRRIVTTLKLQLSLDMQWRYFTGQHTDNPEAYDNFLPGFEYATFPRQGL